MFSLRIKKKCQFLSKQILVGQMDFDHLHVPGQVVKFDNFTTLPTSNRISPINGLLNIKKMNGINEVLK